MDINSIIASELNKNATVNTFIKGMNTDVADNMMPSDQYRMAKNLRVITNDGNSNGELRLIEGGKDITHFTENILAATQIRDYGILVTEDDRNKWSIWKFNSDENDNNRCVRLFGPCEDKIGDSISLVTRYEDDDNVKLYIADGKHSLMYLKFSLDESESQSTSINHVLSSPEHYFGGFGQFAEIEGQLKGAAVQYAYILYNKYGNSSNISPLSQLKPVTTNVFKGAGIRTGVHQNSTGNKGYQFTINENNTHNFEKIKVFRITYEQIGQDPKIDIIVDDYLGGDGTEYTVNDSGNSIINYSYSEFIGLSKTMIIPKQIESKNDYLFASNVSYQIESNKDIITKFANLDLSCQITTPGYTDMNTQFNLSLWQSASGAYTSFQFNKNTTAKRSLRRDEIYRYGIVLYDKYGNPWPVKFLCDLRTPPINNLENGEELKNLDVTFSIKWGYIRRDCGTDFVNYFKSFEIVRCKRNPEDRFTITQGIVGRTLECRNYNQVQSELSASGDYYVVNPNTTSTNMLCSSGFMSTDRLVVYPTLGIRSDSDIIVDRTFAVSSKDTVLFASPEVCYQQDDVLNLINIYKSNLQIKAIWQQVDGLSKEGNRDFKNYSETENTVVKFNEDQYDNITGLSFLKYKLTFYLTDLTYHKYQESNQQGSLWISSRLARPVHEPLGYDSQYNNGQDVQQYSDDGGQNYTRSSDILIDQFFRSPNNVELRKTIYNEFSVNFSNARILNTSQCLSAIQNSIGIQDVKSVNVPKYNDFANDKTFTFKNNTTSIQSYTFVPWSVPTIMNLSTDNAYGGDSWFDKRFGGDVDYIDAGYETSTDYPISAVGKSLIIKTSGDWFNDARNNDINLAVTICNIRKPNTVPYGGYTDYARENSIYYSFGDYDLVNQSNNQSITITSGDCFIQKFRYNAAKTFYVPKQRYALNMSTIYIVPIESDIDMNNEVGWSSKYNTNDDVRYIQDEAAALRGYTQTEPCYQANTAYNNNQTARYFTGQDKDSVQDINYDYRVCYSNQKSNNESTDSWLTFKSANYIDVDTRYGQITNLRLFKDTLLFWQEQATGVLSVNERTMIQDANDTNIILGNGWVLQRYDYLTIQYGMKPGQFVDGQSNTTLYWWDGHRKEIVSYAGGNAVMPMNKVKTISNYINSKNESSKPAIAHDIKYNEILFDVVDNNTLAYSEVTQQFTSVYDVLFKHKMYFNNRLVITDDNTLYEWNKSSVNYTFNPYIKFVINSQSLYNNTYDLMQIGGELYDGTDFSNIQMKFNTPSGQEGRIINGKNPGFSNTDYAITNREYDFRLTVPRAGQIVSGQWKTADWGDRLRGKTMECELTSTSDDRDFSLQYIITKYRKSWI